MTMVTRVAAAALLALASIRGAAADDHGGGEPRPTPMEGEPPMPTEREPPMPTEGYHPMPMPMEGEPPMPPERYPPMPTEEYHPMPMPMPTERYPPMPMEPPMPTEGGEPPMPTEREPQMPMEREPPMPTEREPPMPTEGTMPEERPERDMAMPGPRPPCRCERTWKWMSMTYHGCARTSDSAMMLWCMSPEGERCTVATKSTMAPGRYWMECPYEHWVHEGGWNMRSSQGATNMSSMGTWLEEKARGSRHAPDGHHRMALRGSYMQSMDEAKAPEEKQAMKRSQQQVAKMREHTKPNKQDWVASVYTEEDTDHRTKKKVHHGIQYTDTKGKRWKRKATKVTKKIHWYQQKIPAKRGSSPAEQIKAIQDEAARRAERANKELEAFVDCPFWRKMLGYQEACMKVYQLRDHGTHGESPGNIVV